MTVWLRKPVIRRTLVSRVVGCVDSARKAERVYATLGLETSNFPPMPIENNVGGSLERTNMSSVTIKISSTLISTVFHSTTRVLLFNYLFVRLFFIINKSLDIVGHWT